MKAKTLLRLVVLCGVALAIVWALRVWHARPSSGWAIGQKIAPNFPLNDIERITVRNAEGSVTIGKQDGIWKVAEYYDFPANFGKVAELLQQVYDMTVGQQLKVRGTSLGRLRLLGPAAAGADESGQGTALQCFTKGATPVFECIIGAQKQRQPDPRNPYGFAAPEGTYIRVASATAGAPAGSETVLLVKDIITTPASAEGWIERQIINVPADAVRSITITPPGGEPATLSRTNSTDAFSMAGLAHTQQVNNANATTLAGALSYFTIQKVVPPAEASTNTALDHAWTFSVRAADGITYTLTLADTNVPDAYARLQVSYDAAHADPSAEGADKAKEKAELLSARFTSWLYVLPSYKAGELRKTRADLITVAAPSGASEDADDDKDTGEEHDADDSAAQMSNAEVHEQVTAPEEAGTEPVSEN